MGFLFEPQTRTMGPVQPSSLRAQSKGPKPRPNIKKQIKKKKIPGFTSKITKSQITAKPFSLMRGKLVTNHKDPCFHLPHFKSQIPQKKKNTEFINYQTKNNTKQYNPTR